MLKRMNLTLDASGVESMNVSEIKLLTVNVSETEN